MAPCPEVKRLMDSHFRVDVRTSLTDKMLTVSKASLYHHPGETSLNRSSSNQNCNTYACQGVQVWKHADECFIGYKFM